MPAFAEYLPHFGLDGSRGRAAMPRAAEPPPERPVEERLAEAEARGRAAGEAAAKGEWKRLEAEGEAAFQRRLAEARATWTAAEADRLAAGLGEAFGAIEARLRDAVAEALAPFLTAAATERAVAELAETLARLQSSERGVRLAVTGPEDLLAAFRARLADALPPIDYRTADQTELRAVAGDTVIETQIGAWAARLSTGGAS